MVNITSTQTVVKQAVDVARDLDEVAAKLGRSDIRLLVEQISSLLATTKIDLAEIRSTHENQLREIERLTSALGAETNP